MGDGNNLNVILGRKRLGKTTVTRTFVLEQLAHTKDTRFVVLDSTSEFCALRRVEVLDGVRYTGEEAAQYALEIGDCTLVLPEADLHLPNNGPGLRPNSALHTIVRRGRHFNVAIICDTQRVASIHTDVTGLADTVILFRHREVHDLEAIKKAYGAAVMERVRNLPDYEFLRLDP